MSDHKSELLGLHLAILDSGHDPTGEIRSSAVSQRTLYLEKNPEARLEFLDSMRQAIEVIKEKRQNG